MSKNNSIKPPNIAYFTAFFVEIFFKKESKIFLTDHLSGGRFFILTAKKLPIADPVM
jgi:hypothetical protein